MHVHVYVCVLLEVELHILCAWAAFFPQYIMNIFLDNFVLVYYVIFKGCTAFHFTHVL